MQNTLIAGMGEIGKALKNVLDPHYMVMTKDISPTFSGEIIEQVDILHICFPYSDKFVEEVKELQRTEKPKYTIIHSTCPVGTSRECGAIFSPVVGKHPDLEKSLTTFTKFLAGENASEVSNYFRRAGMKVVIFPKQETLELAKISQTTFYALMIEYIKDLDKQCKENNLSFSEVYTLPSMDYNLGYEKLGNPEFKMPLLIPIQTPQSGHCTINNLEFWNTPFTKLIKELNG